MTEAPALEIQLQAFTAGSPDALQGARNVAVVEGPRGKGHLFAVVEVHGASKGRPTVAEDVVAILEAAYLEASGGITSALRQAFEAANQHLLRVNEERGSQDRFLAGASCLVIRDGDAYIAQAGPSTIFLQSREAIQRYPSQSPWLEGDWPDELDELYMSPLGSHLNVPVDLFHHPVELGDRVLLVTSSLARLTEAADIRAILGAPSAAAMAQRAAALGEEGQASGLALRLSLPGEEEEPLPLEALVEPLTDPEPAAAGAGSLAQESAMPVYDGDEEYLDLYDEEEEEPRPERGGPSRTGAAVDALGGVLGDVLRSLGGVLLVVLGGVARLVPVVAAQAGSALSVWLPRVLPGGEERPGYARPRRSPREVQSHRRFLWLALAVPVVLGLLIVTTRSQYQRSRERQFQSHMAQAQEKISAAASLSEPSQVRELLRRAEAQVSRALAIDPGSSEASSLQGQLLVKLDDLDGVTRVIPTQLVHLDEAGVRPGRLVVRGIDVYWLDTGHHRVYKVLLNGERTDLGQQPDNPILMRKGDERENIVVQDLVDIVWLGPGGERARDNLAILDRAGHLLEYEPSRGIFLVPLVGTDVWRRPQLLAGHRGQLYLLDPNLNQILKYEPTVDGYPRPPTFYLSPRANVDLSGSVDLAVDGHVYVLRADGTVLKLSEGQAVDFRLAGHPEPLAKPVALFSNEGSASLYIADAGLEALLQFSKEGVFERQFKAPYDGLSLEALESLVVDERAGRIFFGVGGTLYTAAVPGS